MNIYTKDDWARDGSFHAVPGQEVSEDIYYEMYNVMPPLRLPRNTAENALEALKLPVHAGFMMGEPHSSDRHGVQYLAFGMNDYGKGKHYFYLGLGRKDKPVPDGTYYFFDTLNALPNDGLVKADKYTGDRKARSFAIDCEATLFKRVYRHGEIVEESLLYEPVCQ